MSEKKLNFNPPSGFLHCFNAKCQLADTCLRYQSAACIPPECKSVLVVNPSCASSGETCQEFLSMESQRCAYGIDHLYDELPYAVAVKMKNYLISYFGKNIYYRFKRKEKGFTPQLQVFVQSVFRDFGVEKIPHFDYYEPFFKQ